MREGSSNEGPNRLNLNRALRILQHAGRPDPMQHAGSYQQKLQRLLDYLCDLSVHDGLTGLVNATFFHAALARELDRSNRTGRTCGLLLLDIDYFKLVNDAHGHTVGDAILQSFARHMKHSMRGMDTAARIGGDEFAIILPECTPDDAVHAATRIHSALSPLSVLTGDAKISVTASAGLVWTDMRPALKEEEFLDQADKELYRAKESGRCKLCHAWVSSVQVSPAERAALFPDIAKEEPDGE